MEVEEAEDVEDLEDEDPPPESRLTRKVANLGIARGRYYTSGRMNSERAKVAENLPWNGRFRWRSFHSMRNFKAIAVLCFFSMCTPSLIAHAQTVRTIYLVRHADKVSEDTDALLNDAGRKRAECLANTLADAQIDEIFTSDLQRTQQTAAPLAEKLHLMPKAVPISKPDELIEAIQSSKAANVLVVWHDATLAKIMRALGAPEITPIAHTEYDRFFILTMSGDKARPRPRFTELRYCDCAK
jgi:phosphohistidine phosphatase SixA